jgi:hypothetical protein
MTTASRIGAEAERTDVAIVSLLQLEAATRPERGSHDARWIMFQLSAKGREAAVVGFKNRDGGGIAGGVPIC